MTDLLPSLAGSKLLCDLDASIRSQLAGISEYVSANRGQLLFRPGEQPRGVFIVVSGHVAVSLQADAGREKVIEICGPGESFGEEFLLAGEAHLAGARALTVSLLVLLPRGAMLEAIERHPGVALHVLRSVSHKTVAATHRIGGAATRPASQRVADYLMGYVGAGREPCDIVLPVPKQIAASLLGMTKETFSRLLAELAAEGLIAVRGRRIRVPDPGRLTAFCDTRPPS